MVNVLLVEDSKITRDMVERYISASPDYLLVATLANAANAEIVCMRDNVDLILMDVCTADDESGISAAEKIKKRNNDIRIIIMTSMPEHSFIMKSKAAGCDSFWYNEFGDVELLDVMDRTMRGESVYPDATPIVLVGNAGSDELTDKELSILRQLSIGLKYEEIADVLNVSMNTVKFHVKNLLMKTGYRSTLQLVVDVVSKKLILPKF